MSLYVNAVLQADTDTSGVGWIDPPQSREVTVGATYFPDEFVDGIIDDVKIYDRALSGSEILQNYQANNVPEPSALLLLGGGLSGVLAFRRMRYIRDQM